MTRIAQPFEAVTPAGRPDAESPVVGSAPTLATRTVHGEGYDYGIVVIGSRNHPTPVQKPYAGQGLESPVFPYYQPSTVAPDLVGMAFFVTANLYSPVSHAAARDRMTRVMPVPATAPPKKMPGVNNRSRRGGGGAYTYASPFSAQQWPTSSQWLASQINSGVD